MRKPAAFIVICLSLFCGYTAFGQNRMPLVWHTLYRYQLKIVSPYTSLIEGNFSSPMPHLLTILENSQSISSNHSLYAIESSVHYDALFCRIENNIHEHFKIWIKFRAGDDDSYRKMISQ